MENSKVENMNLSNSITENVLISLRKIMQSISLHSKYLVKKVGLTGPQLVILLEVSKFDEVSVGKIALKKEHWFFGGVTILIGAAFLSVSLRMV